MNLPRLVLSLALICSTAPALATPHHNPPTSRRPAATVQVGKASWYGHGRLTASGARFDPRAMTCAHRTLPLGSVVKVTDVDTGKHVVAEVNDRGPYVRGRIVDLSEGAALRLGARSKGVTTVRVEVLRFNGRG